VAATELAVCLPVVVLLVLATIEACSAIFLKQSLTIAAYEGARTALVPGADATLVKAKCSQILADRQIEGAAVSIAPADPSSLNPGDFVDITVTAPCDANSLIPTSFYRGRNMTARASMMIEH
jgi:hypothetical protein